MLNRPVRCRLDATTKGSCMHVIREFQTMPMYWAQVQRVRAPYAHVLGTGTKSEGSMHTSPESFFNHADPHGSRVTLSKWQWPILYQWGHAQSIYSVQIFLTAQFTTYNAVNNKPKWKLKAALKTDMNEFHPSIVTHCLSVCLWHHAQTEFIKIMGSTLRKCWGKIFLATCNTLPVVLKWITKNHHVRRTLPKLKSLQVGWTRLIPPITHCSLSTFTALKLIWAYNMQFPK